MKKVSRTEARTEYRKENIVIACARGASNGGVRMRAYKDYGLSGHSFAFEASRIRKEFECRNLEYYI